MSGDTDAKGMKIRVFAARALAAVVVLAVSSSVWGQSPLPDLSLEDLMKLDAGHVYSASERLQPVTEAPSSVSFITAEEIARFGYRTLADILRGNQEHDGLHEAAHTGKPTR